MKTKLLSFALLSVFLISCVDDDIKSNDPQLDFYTKALCRYWWIDEFLDGNSTVWVQFNFEPDGTGYELIETTPPSGIPVREEYPFFWGWTSPKFNSIGMEYGPGDKSNIKDLLIDGAILTGFLNDQEIKYLGKIKSY